MTNSELVENYLANRLTESERSAFDLQIESDPSLKADVDMQKQIIESIKNARVAELKSMLNNVSITPPASGLTNLKIAAGIIGAGILIGSLYYYFQPKGLMEAPNLSTSIQDSVQGNDSAESIQKVIPDEEPIKENKQQILTDTKEDLAIERKNTTTLPPVINQPKIEVTDPTAEMSAEDNQGGSVTENSKSLITASHIQVETDSSNKKYNFHYQFNNGKLQLFGPFDKSLYEILEINGDTHSIFLFYKENYYLLDENQVQITKLPLIKDSGLIKMLKEYRGS